jgi:hypothetical protein
VRITALAGAIRDAAGNNSAESSPSAVITVDNAAPSLSFTLPAANTSFATRTGITVSGACESGLNVTVAGSGVSPTVNAACTSGAFSTTVNLTDVDEDKVITISQTDAAGLSASVNRTVKLDTVKPVVAVTSPVAATVGSNGLMFSGTCETGLLVWFKGTDVQGSPVSTTCTGGSFTNYLVNFSAGDGAKTVNVEQVDAAGNISLPLSVALVNDTQAPTITIGAPSTTLVRSATSVSFALSFSDGTGSGVNQVSLANSDIALVTTGTVANCSKVVTGTGDATRTVTLSNCGGDGTVKFNVAAGVIRDAGGNLSTSTGPSGTVTVDNTGANVQISSPVNGAVVSSTVTLVGVCETGITVNITGTGLSAPTTATCTSASFSKAVTLASGDGTKNISVSQTDAANNTTTANLTVTLDTTAPAVTLTSPSNNAAVPASMAFVGTCETGLQVLFEGTGVLNPPQTATCSAGAFNSTVTFTSGDGAKAISVKQVDAAGNISSPVSISVTRDTVLPVVTIGAPTVSIMKSSGTVNFTLSFSDTGGSGVTTVNITDTVKLSLTTSGTAACATKSVTGTGFAERTVSLSNCSGNGSVRITAQAGAIRDAAGNDSLEAGPSAVVLIDNTAPALSFSAPAANQYFTSRTGIAVEGSCETGLSVTIAGGGVVSPVTATCPAGTFSAAVDLTAVDEAKTISISQTDAAGNSASLNRSVNVDSTRPLVSIISPAAGAVGSGSLLFTGSCESGLLVWFSGTGVLNAPQSATCSGGGSYSATVLFTNSEGGRTVSVQQTDAAGNSSLPLSVSVVNDTLPPVVSLAAPSATLVKSTATVTVVANFSDTGSGVQTVPMTTSDVVLTTTGNATCAKALNGSGTASQTIVLSNCTGNGTVKFDIAAGAIRDGANNASAAAGPSATITVDNQSPVVTVSSPAANANVSASINIVGTCETGLSVTVSGSGAATPVTTTCSNSSFTANTTLSAGDGTKNLSISQTDGAGNTGTTSHTVVLDSSAPVLTVTSPLEGAAGSASITFTGTCENGLAVIFEGTGVFNSTQTATCSSHSFTYLLTFSSGDGAKVVNVKQVDAVGNQSVAIVRNLIRDTVPPVVSLGTPSVTAMTSSGFADIVMNFSDTGGSGVSSVALNSGNVLVSETGVSCTKAVNGSGSNSRTVRLSSCSGTGTVRVAAPAAAIRDAAGNDSLATNYSDVIVIDNTAPLLTTTSPANNASVGTAITLTGTCEAGLTITISSVDVVGSPQTATCGGGGTFSKALTLSGSQGTKVLSLSESDAAGNTSTASLSLTLDTIAPTVAITSPDANSIINSTNSNLPLSGTCEIGLNVVLEGDVPANQSTASCTTGSFTFANWQLNAGDGNKTVTVSQTDAGGNKGTASRVFILDTLPVTTAPALTSGQSILGLKGTLTGTCDSGQYLTTTATVTSGTGTVVSTTCVSNVLTINVSGLSEGRNYVTITATTTRRNGFSNSSSTGIWQQFFCPTGYVAVPGKFATDADTAGLGRATASAGNADAGYDPTKDFCVMKHRAKVATSNNGGQTPWEPVFDGYNAAWTVANYWPESRPDGTPWTSITRNNSSDRCKALNEAYGHCSGTGCYSTFNNTTWGYRLPSNTQWQVLLRNIESVGANWSSGTARSGYLWRGHSDNTPASNSILHSQTALATSAGRALAGPRSDDGSSDYFGTGNSATENTSSTSGWIQRRRFVLSNGASVWDVSGNTTCWMSDNRADLGIPAADDSAGLSTAGYQSFRNAGVNRYSAVVNLILGSLGIGGLQLFEDHNAGLIGGGSGVAIGRCSSYTGGGGMFQLAQYADPATTIDNEIGFRCSYIPPTVGADTDFPVISTVNLAQVNGGGDTTAPVTVREGGYWNLAWTISDTENTGTLANRLYVQIRRKGAASDSDFPTVSDPVHKQGFNLTTLNNESAWVQNASTGRYTKNDGAYINYLITVIDPSGKSTSRTFSVYNEQSCPPGYVGVPGIPQNGLGNTAASVGHSNKQYDPSTDFCVMKYPAKVMSAGTTIGQTNVGGKFEPIMNGNNTFSQVGSYTSVADFENKIVYLPESRSSGTPWVRITKSDAVTACRALETQHFGTMPDTSTGSGFQIVSNTEWQVMARNVESVASNWSGNAVGSGKINSGHNDSAISATEVTNSWCFGCTSPSSSLSAAPNSWNDANSYFATGNTAAAAWNTLGTTPAAGTEQKRTHTLTNGAIVWDLGGNVNHFTLEGYYEIGAQTYTSTSGHLVWNGTGVKEFNRVESDNWSWTTQDFFKERLLIAPWGNFISTQGVGRWIPSCNTDCWNLVRGSGFAATTGNGGIYRAQSPGGYGWSNANDVGFRCVFIPSPVSGTVSGTAPVISGLQRVNALDELQTQPVTIARGGSWNVEWNVTDAESPSNITVNVYRKIATTATDFPTTAETVYATGNLLKGLFNETAWVGTNANNNTFVNYLITATDASGNTVSRTLSVQNTASCPPNYVGVPGTSTAGLGSGSATVGNANAWLDPSRDFCVMKYPAKNVSGVATSAMADTPWVNVNRSTAASACTSLGTNYRLMSNTHWQVLARDIDSVAKFTGYGWIRLSGLVKGHTDGSPNTLLANSVDSDPFFGTFNSGLSSQKRTHALSSGNIIWDIGGNVYHWVSDDVSSLGASTTLTSGNTWKSCDRANIADASADRLIISTGLNSNGTVNDPNASRCNHDGGGTYVNSVGKFYAANAGALVRGGASQYLGGGDVSNTGLFGAYFGFAATDTHGFVGFRCVYMPP